MAKGQGKSTNCQVEAPLAREQGGQEREASGAVSSSQDCGEGLPHRDESLSCHLTRLRSLHWVVGMEAGGGDRSGRGEDAQPALVGASVRHCVDGGQGCLTMC